MPYRFPPGFAENAIVSESGDQAGAKVAVAVVVSPCASEPSGRTSHTSLIEVPGLRRE